MNLTDDEVIKAAEIAAKDRQYWNYICYITVGYENGKIWTYSHDSMRDYEARKLLIKAGEFLVGVYELPRFGQSIIIKRGI